VRCALLGSDQREGRDTAKVGSADVLGRVHAAALVLASGRWRRRHRSSAHALGTSTTAKLTKTTKTRALLLLGDLGVLGGNLSSASWAEVRLRSKRAEAIGARALVRRVEPARKRGLLRVIAASRWSDSS
jgi:hypothetical protein